MYTIFRCMPPPPRRIAPEGKRRRLILRGILRKLNAENHLQIIDLSGKLYMLDMRGLT